MFEILYTTKFKKDLKKIVKSKTNYQLVHTLLKTLEAEGVKGLDLHKNKPHRLIAQYKGNWECHVKPDLLLIWYEYDEPTKQIILIRLGSHSELFD